MHKKLDRLFGGIMAFVEGYGQYDLTPSKFEGANTNHGKPVNWDDERDGECGVLPVEVVQPLGASPRYMSCWRVTLWRKLYIYCGLGRYG